MKINCLYDKLANVSELVPHPKNRNQHSKEQIERLAKILQVQGWRYPIKISKRSGFVTSGHGRIEAARFNKWEQVPVNYQDYDNEDLEYSDLIADNAIADWSVLNFSQINDDLASLGPDMDLDILGIKNFTLDWSDKFDPNKEWQGMPEFNQNDKTAFRTIQIHFYDQQGVNNFAELLKQTITDKTKMLYYPEIVIEKYMDKRYEGES